MRLICPNCVAQYEIPDDVMPPGGRDVQCSNCEHAWFQEHPDDETQGAPASDTAPAKETQTPQHSEKDDAPARKTEQEPEPFPSAEVSEPSAPTRKTLDPAVASVLQAEAQREAEARKKQASGSMETQPDLGLADSSSVETTREKARAARQRTVPTSAEPSPPAGEHVATETHSTPMPNVERINSTMRSNSDRSPDTDAGQTAQVEQRARRSFSRGFTLMVVVAAVLAVAYAMAPELARAIPDAAEWIGSYVDTVDQGRLWLDAQLEAVLTWLDATTAS